MPHYRDGTEARLGDLVAGVPYNRKGRRIVGQIVGITPGSESCNCRVLFAEEIDLPPYGTVIGYRSIVGVAGGDPARPALFAVAEDYGELRAFDLVVRTGE